MFDVRCEQMERLSLLTNIEHPTSNTVVSASDLLRALVRIPSLSREERAAADFVAETAQAHGLTTWRRDDNVVVELGEGDDVLLFNSHLDVVPPSEEMPHGAFDGYEEGGVLWGRGTVDAKASGAAMLAALLRLHAEGFDPQNGRVLVALTACEETGGPYNGLEALRPHLPKLAGAVVGEPTELHPCLAQKGMLQLRVEARGRTAHAARAHLGENAVFGMARALTVLETLRFEREDPYLGRPTLTVTTIEGGTARNVVPDRCEAVLDVRSVPAYTHDELLEEVRRAVPGVEVTVRSGRFVPCRTDPESRIARAVAAAHPSGVPFGSPTASDWVFLRDVPTVKMGPGPSERSHTPEERIELSEVERAANVYAAVARAFFDTKG
jgi:acetylornithine deacetylase